MPPRPGTRDADASDYDSPPPPPASPARTARGSPSPGSSQKMCLHGRRRHVCKQCEGAGWCAHGRRKDRCSVCKANAAGLILKLPLQAKPFEVMYLLQKHTEYKPLHKPNGTQDSRIQSRLFHKKVGTFASQVYDWTKPRQYKYVMFFNGQPFSLKYPWFVRPYRSVRIVYKVHRKYYNGLNVTHRNEPVASISLGRKIVCCNNIKC